MQIERIKENATEAEAFLKTLANKNRLMILCSLLEGECTVGQLNQSVPIAQSALSQHLAALRKASLVSTRRDAQSIYYSVSDERVKQIIEKMYQFFCAPDV